MPPSMTRGPHAVRALGIAARRQVPQVVPQVFRGYFGDSRLFVGAGPEAVIVTPALATSRGTCACRRGRRPEQSLRKSVACGPTAPPFAAPCRRSLVASRSWSACGHRTRAERLREGSLCRTRYRCQTQLFRMEMMAIFNRTLFRHFRARLSGLSGSLACAADSAACLCQTRQVACGSSLLAAKYNPSCRQIGTDTVGARPRLPTSAATVRSAVSRTSSPNLSPHRKAQWVTVTGPDTAWLAARDRHRTRAFHRPMGSRRHPPR